MLRGRRRRGREAVGDFFYVLDESARILFVDDDPILREFAQVNLASPQASVEVAANGAEALERLTEGYDIVLLDLEMPPYGRTRAPGTSPSSSRPAGKTSRPSTGPFGSARRPS